MPVRHMIQLLTVLLAIAMTAPAAAPALAQGTGEADGEEGRKNGEGGRAGATKADEIAEARRRLEGPAGQPECVWVGRRIVSLLWRDDLETAARHRELYAHFGCPGGHIQKAFACLVRHGELDPKVPESLNMRVHSCWIAPDQEIAPVTLDEAGKAADHEKAKQ